MSFVVCSLTILRHTELICAQLNRLTDFTIVNTNTQVITTCAKDLLILGEVLTGHNRVLQSKWGVDSCHVHISARHFTCIYLHLIFITTNLVDEIKAQGHQLVNSGSRILPWSHFHTMLFSWLKVPLKTCSIKTWGLAGPNKGHLVKKKNKKTKKTTMTSSEPAS